MLETEKTIHLHIFLTTNKICSISKPVGIHVAETHGIQCCLGAVDVFVDFFLFSTNTSGITQMTLQLQRYKHGELKSCWLKMSGILPKKE